MLEAALIRLGLRQPERKVLLSGNDSAGKTTLLYRAKTGEIIRTIPTIGFNDETLSPCIGGPLLSVRDVGGGGRIGNLYLHYICDCNALVFVLRPTDPRLWSALWELYVIVRHAAQNGNPGIAVCVVIPINECADGSCRTWECMQASTTDAEQAVSSYTVIARMAQRECLPPGGTRRWSQARRWCACDDGAAASAPTDEVDSEWLASWEQDRRAAAGRMAGTVIARALTSSHGIEMLHDAAASPPLAAVHHGPWVVLPIDMHARAGDAMLPFQWVARMAS